jgi:hypothetical protein
MDTGPVFLFGLLPMRSPALARHEDLQQHAGS